MSFFFVTPVIRKYERKKGKSGIQLVREIDVVGNNGWLCISAKEVLWGPRREVQRGFITEEEG